MPQHQLGRGATLNTKRAAGGRIAPIKRAWFGEFQPNFHGVSIRHSQWVCQVRRIQSYVRHVSHRDVFDAHAGLLWGSICRAKGFCPDFMTWWNNCDHATLDAPAICPVSPPSCRVAQAMFESLALSVRSLEKDLVKSSRQYARLRRANNPNVIFQDIKVAPTQGVELLCKPVVATVSIILSSLHSWNLDRPVMVGGRRRDIYWDHDCLWLDSVDDIEQGTSVSQLNYEGPTAELAAEFLETWGARWKRHDDVPPERWHTIMQFAQDKLPRGWLPWIPLDAEALRSYAVRKQTTTSAGLDGVSIQDLRAMPNCVLENFCRIFATAESSGMWPAQMVWPCDMPGQIWLAAVCLRFSSNYCSWPHL